MLRIVEIDACDHQVTRLHVFGKIADVVIRDCQELVARGAVAIGRAGQFIVFLQNPVRVDVAVRCQVQAAADFAGRQILAFHIQLPDQARMRFVRNVVDKRFDQLIVLIVRNAALGSREGAISTVSFAWPITISLRSSTNISSGVNKPFS